MFGSVLQFYRWYICQQPVKCLSFRVDVFKLFFTITRKNEKSPHLVRDLGQALLLEDVNEMSGNAEMNEQWAGELQMVVEN